MESVEYYTDSLTVPSLDFFLPARTRPFSYLIACYNWQRRHNAAVLFSIIDSLGLAFTMYLCFVFRFSKDSQRSGEEAAGRCKRVN